MSVTDRAPKNVSIASLCTFELARVKVQALDDDRAASKFSASSGDAGAELPKRT